jgi:Asp-tRNA(Asn)/Glu-tRNA(Gln) amidotransferase A subunit family amidase
MLEGLPVIVKDMIDVTGFHVTGGSKALKDARPQDDAFIIAKLRKAGASINEVARQLNIPRSTVSKYSVSKS